MHRMHRIFSGDGWLVFPDILKSARDHRPSPREVLLQQPPVLIILCILCIDVPFIVLLDGSAQSRGVGARLAGKREFPKGDRPASTRDSTGRKTPTSTSTSPMPPPTWSTWRSEKSPAGYPPPHHRDDTPRERGRPARMLSLRLPLSFPAMLQPTALPAGTAGGGTGPGRRRAMAPLPVDPSGGDGRGCARLGAGGTPALPGSHHSMTSSHQGHK